MTIFYFTATGNSLDIAKRLATPHSASPQNAQLRSIAHERDGGSYTDDVIGIVFPVFACNLPAPVTRFIKNTELKADYLFAVVAHGGDPGNIGGILTGIAPFDNVFTVETWSNYLPFNPDIPPKAVDVTADVQRIAEQVASREKGVSAPNPTPPFESVPWSRMALEYRRRPECTLCGTCARVCPAGNCVIGDNGEPVFSDHCEGCMACLQNCPTAALHMPNEPTRYRYRNPNITLEEIIAANEQGVV